MKHTQSPLWFKAKSYGWGWTPSTWEGWFFVSIYLVQMISISLVAEQLVQTWEGSIVFGIIIITALASLIILSYKTGEKPGWRWGNNT
jgi:peptidoglycan/LPS O-acetylase OafA/YrhL